MAIKLLPGEDRTGEVWYPYGFVAEAFVVLGAPSVKINRNTNTRTLTHLVLHLHSGLAATRSEISRPTWVRNYARLAFAPGSLAKREG